MLSLPIILLDIITLVIIIMCGVSALKNGFLATILKKIAPLLSFFVALTGAQSVGPIYRNVAAKLAPSINALQNILQYVLGFITVFVLSMILLAVFAFLFKLLNGVVNGIPVLGVVNKIVCVLFGLFIGYFNANFFVYILRVLGTLFDSIDTAIAGSVITKFVAEHSIFGFVAEKITALFV
jgi:uncharacterized membrane protein required for colicin V production